MTKEEKEIIIDLFNSFKYIPTLNEICTERENGINEGINRCLEEIQNFGCGETLENQEDKKEQLDELLGEYNAKLSRMDDIFQYRHLPSTTISDYDLGVYETLSDVIDDLESLRSEDEKH